MNKKRNLILTIAISAVSIGCLVPSVAIAASEGDFFGRAKTWEVDVSDIQRKNIASLSSKISTVVSTGGTFKMRSFSLSFDDSEKLIGALVFFDIREGSNYEFKVNPGESKGYIIERNTEERITKSKQDITRESFAVISNSSKEDGIKEKYESTGTYVSKGELLDTGISESISNYEYTQNGLLPVDSLVVGVNYRVIERTVLISGNSKVMARYFVSC